MPKKPLAELLDAAKGSSEPSLVDELKINPGGVDPLGLRQINFRLMDQVIPGFNNVARRIRPYSLLAWAWHRAAVCAKAQGYKEIEPEKMKDFVERMEFLFVWSQFLINPAAELPGRDTFLPYLNRSSLRFGDAAWQSVCDKRRNSTSLNSALNYGPAVKYLGWTVAMKERTFACAEDVLSAASAFEASLGELINEPVFNVIGSVANISRDSAIRIGASWSLDSPTQEEKNAMRNSLTNRELNGILSSSAACIREITAFRNVEIGHQQARIDLCGHPSLFSPSKDAKPVVAKWRVVQLRQLFRLALEALLHWVTLNIYDVGRPVSTPQLVQRLIEQVGAAHDIETWLATSPQQGEESLPEQIGRLQEALKDRQDFQGVAIAIRDALSFSLSEDHPDIVFQEPDRLPIAQAQRDIVSLRDTPLKEALISLLEKWVFGQHVFWAVSRGLGDARAQGNRSILRLKILQDERGWSLAPGINLCSTPRATEDRIETFVTLLQEAGALDCR